MVSYLAQNEVGQVVRILLANVNKQTGHPMANLERTLCYWVFTGIFLNMRMAVCSISHRRFGYPMAGC